MDALGALLQLALSDPETKAVLISLLGGPAKLAQLVASKCVEPHQISTEALAEALGVSDRQARRIKSD